MQKEEKILLKADLEDAGQRLDLYISNACEELSRSAAQNLIEKGMITVGGKPSAKNYKLRSGDTVEVVLPEAVEYDALPQEMPLDIVYEDPHLIVVNKPKDMVVHPAPGNPDGTLVNGILYHCGGALSGINGVIRPGIVHRIDKDTSGLLVIAKDDKTHIGLSEQLQAHIMERQYHAVVYGNVKQEEGRIKAPIGRHPVDRKKMCVTTKNSREAATNYQVIARYKGFTYLRLRLETGRTHQIRVHLAHIGHPVAGDPVYGPTKVISALRGQCLHAKTLGFIHPITGEQMQFDSDLPSYLLEFLDKLERMT